MKRHIKLYIILVSTISLLVCMAVSLFWVDNRFLKEASRNLNAYVNGTISLTNTLPSNFHTFAEDLSTELSNNVRITIIRTDGTVMADSEVDDTTLPSHADRPEVQQAMESGAGQDVRQSELTGVKTLYVAKPWREQYILRMSMPVANASEFVISILPIVVLIIIFIIIAVTVVSERLSRKILEPYTSLVNNIEDAVKNRRDSLQVSPDDSELQPLVQQVNAMLVRLRKQIDDIRLKSDEIESIIYSMDKGLLLLDDDYSILMANPQGLAFLSVSRVPENVNIQSIVRNDSFSKWLENAKNEKNAQFDLEGKDGKTYRIYINTVTSGGYVLLVSDVTDIVKAERMRSEFTANVSHELKTPLTAISGFAELLKNDIVKEEDQIKDYQNKIYQGAQTMMNIINDLLRLSEIEHSSTSPIEPVQLERVFAYAKDVLHEKMLEKNIHYQMNGSGEIRANEEYIKEIAVNLLDNAIKYNHNNGTITVDIIDGDISTSFSVKDSGIGIPQQDIDRIFERFYRVDKGRSRETGGTGLGLSIVKHIVELYGGVISVKSGKKGTTFTITFYK